MVPRSSGTRAPRSVIYVRVSTQDQTVENQKPELLQLAEARGFEIVEVIEEVMSAAKQRPGFERVMLLARKGMVNAVIIFALDRIGRSMIDNLQVVLELDRLGVEVISSREPWLQMQGPVRQLLVGVFSWVAQQERTRIIERTKLGVERARKSGKRLGRPPVQLDAVRAMQLRRRGVSIRQAAKKLGVGSSTLQKRRGKTEGDGTRLLGNGLQRSREMTREHQKRTNGGGLRREPQPLRRGRATALHRRSDRAGMIRDARAIGARVAVGHRGDCSAGRSTR